MIILAIETSCDETGIALVEARGGLRAPKFTIHSNLISSQIPVHRPFGGVVPNLAKREHIKNLPILYRKIFGKLPIAYSKSNKNHKPAIDLIAVTVGPGLEPALWTGINFAKQLHQQLTTNNKQRKIKLVGANHLKGHLYSFLATEDKSRKSLVVGRKLFPAIGLLVSGGHTILLKMNSLTKWKKLGETRDDAAGEAFDKVARLLKLPYPGGPEIETLSKKGNKDAIDFPRPMLHIKNPEKLRLGARYDFSFSGLKTSVLYYLRDHKRAKRADVAASFQEAAIHVLTKKTMRAVNEFGAKSVILAGGVAANKALRARFKKETKKVGVDFYVPPMSLNTDNAAMIGISAYIDHINKKRYRFEAQGNLNI